MKSRRWNGNARYMVSCAAKYARSAITMSARRSANRLKRRGEVVAGAEAGAEEEEGAVENEVGDLLVRSTTGDV